MARILIGTSGWHYDSWRGAFFPKGLLLRHQLPYYASQFQTAELNGVFYRTPTEAAVRGWREQTGPDFVVVRGHGPGGRYKDNYPAASLSAWAKRIRAWTRQGCDVFVYFDNDQK